MNANQFNSDTAVETVDVSKFYGEVRAVDSLSCTVEKGEFVSLLGPSGCGKTTTLQMIAGFATPTSGRIELAGRNLASIPARQRGLGIVVKEVRVPRRRRQDEHQSQVRG